ncbi:MAG TPA: hypothetical protein VGN34_21640, partial [Ktedonobacteraceae bacterium]
HVLIRLKIPCSAKLLLNSLCGLEKIVLMISSDIQQKLAVGTACNKNEPEVEQFLSFHLIERNLSPVWYHD